MGRLWGWGKRVKRSKTGASPQTPPRGAAPWNPAKGGALGTLHWACGEGKGACGQGAGAGRRDGRHRHPAHTPPSPPHTPSHGVQRPLPLVGVQGARPPGGVRGEAPTLLSFTRLPWSLGVAGRALAGGSGVTQVRPPDRLQPGVPGTACGTDPIIGNENGRGACPGRSAAQNPRSVTGTLPARRSPDRPPGPCLWFRGRGRPR